MVEKPLESTNSQQNNTQNNQQNNNAQGNNSGKQVILGCDSNGVNDAQCQSTIAQIIQSAGYQVTSLGIGPGEFANYSYTEQGKGKIGVYLMAASLVSYLDAGDANFDFNVMGIRGDVTSWGTEQGFKTKGVPKDHHGDCIHPQCDSMQGKTYVELNQQYKPDKVQATWGETPEKLGQNIVALLGGKTTTGGSSSEGGSAILIPDKTFYGLIKQIIGAIDGVFIIANNVAYLISFKQFYEYRNRYDEFIPELEKKDILPDVEKWWSTDGFYNAVEVTYDGGAVKYKHDALVNQYGENVWYYDFPDDDEDTAKAKADALLSAHVRDYSQDIRMTIVYNPNINVGSWIKVPKDVTNMSGVLTKNDTEAKKEEDKPKIINGVTIENITEVVQKLEDGVTKHLEHRKDDEGNEYDIEFEVNDYDIFFVQGYSIRWTSDKAPLMDLHLKYGPDTPEDPINATIGVGGGTTSASGQWGNDTFRIEDICVANNEPIVGSYSGGAQVQQVKELVNSKYKPDPEDYQPRANKNSNYAKKYGAMSSPAEVFAAFRSEYKYSYYADNSPCWTSATDFYDNAGKTANCGDTTCLLKVFFDCIGVPSCGVHINGHYFNAIQINGTWEIIDGVRIDNQTVNFPDGNGYSFGNPCPCNSYKGSGNNNQGGNNS